MNILHIIPRIVPSPDGIVVGGSVNAMLNLISEMNDKCSSRIYTQTDAGMRSRFNNIKYDVIVDENPMKAGSFLYALYFFAFSLWRIVRNKAWGAEQIHGHSGFAPYALLTLTAGKMLKRPAIHSLYCPVLLGQRISWLSLVQKHIYRIIFSRLDRVGAMSENIKRSLLKIGVPKEKIEVLEINIDQSKYSSDKRNKKCLKGLGIEGDSPTMLFVGNLKRSKGLDVLVEALSRLAQNGAKFKFIYTLELAERGREEKRRKILKSIEDGAIADMIMELGIIDNMPDLMASVDLVIFPFRDTNGPSDYPMALLESMASGIPAIGTRVGGIPELIENGHTGILIDPDDVVQLSDAIGKLLNDQALRERYGKNARESFLKRNEIEGEMKKSIDDIYRDLILSKNRVESRAKSSKLFYEKDAPKYDVARWQTPAGKYINEVQISILAEILDGLQGDNFLEIAAGTGRFTKALLDRDKKVTTLDISSAMAEELKANLASHRNYKNLRVIVGDARNIILGPGAFDAVVCFNAFSHIPEHEKVIKETAKVLKHKGYFIFNVPNYMSLYFPFGLYINMRKKALNKDVYTRWYGYRGIKKDLETEGFEIKAITGHLHFPTETPAIFLPAFKGLDRLMRKGPLANLAPILFIEARKISS